MSILIIVLVLCWVMSNDGEMIIDYINDLHDKKMDKL